MTEQVAHPDHYNQYQGFEVIDICEQLRAPDGSGNFNRGNAFKYLARAGWKNLDKQIEDLEKAIFYIQREIDRLRNVGEPYSKMRTLSELMEELGFSKANIDQAKFQAEMIRLEKEP